MKNSSKGVDYISVIETIFSRMTLALGYLQIKDMETTDGRKSALLVDKITVEDKKTKEISEVDSHTPICIWFHYLTVIGSTDVEYYNQAFVIEVGGDKRWDDIKAAARDVRSELRRLRCPFPLYLGRGYDHGNPYNFKHEGIQHSRLDPTQFMNF